MGYFCPNCGEFSLVQFEEGYVCTGCGYLFEQEDLWRFYEGVIFGHEAATKREDFLIKPALCPFCKSSDTKVVTKYIVKDKAYVKCNRCKATGPVKSGLSEKDAKVRAIYAWSV